MNSPLPYSLFSSALPLSPLEHISSRAWNGSYHRHNSTSHTGPHRQPLSHHTRKEIGRREGRGTLWGREYILYVYVKVLRWGGGGFGGEDSAVSVLCVNVSVRMRVWQTEWEIALTVTAGFGFSGAGCQAPRATRLKTFCLPWNWIILHKMSSLLSPILFPLKQQFMHKQELIEAQRPVDGSVCITSRSRPNTVFHFDPKQHLHFFKILLNQIRLLGKN